VKNKNYDNWNKVKVPEDAYSIWPEPNRDYTANVIRLGYSSLLTPKQVFDYDILTETRDVLKETEVPFYDRTLFDCKRIEALSRDGSTKIPMSIVYRKDLEDEEASNEDNLVLKQTAPLFLYGYGSYGACMDPSFDFKRLVLLKRGVVYVIAHIRGGGEMGMPWYEDEGKYLSKQNTFYDFADCAKSLIANKITTR
jgi:oligopeptidase B